MASIGVLLSSWLNSIVQASRPPYPSEQYPTIVKGVIYGPVRFESLDGSEMYLPPEKNGKTVFKDFKPFAKDGKIWGVSNIQKMSHKGWIKTNPTGYYWWTMLKLQQKDSNGTWIPGSEFGWYYRQPLTWRWDVAGSPVDGVLEHWIWTRGYAGAHFD